MESSPNHIEKANHLQKRIYSAMTPAQKWQEVCRLRELAWSLKAAAVRQAHPDWTEDAVKEEVRKIFLYATT